MALAAGSQLGPYEIIDLIGAGGMGEVYRARDRLLGRDVAIKVLPASVGADADRLARFEREARVLAALNHPHIAAIYGVERSLAPPALILELVEGPTLADLIASPPDGSPGLAVERALVLARQIADALETAHAKGIIHRDLKPENIKVTHGGLVKVLDFGLAKVWAADRPASPEAVTTTQAGTRAGALLGTAAYMSPEQVRGGPLDQRSDVWAFGCVLFEMLAGRAPFATGTLVDTLASILDREPDWALLPRSTPRRIRELLRSCLQKDPAARPGTLGAAREAIDATLASPVRTLGRAFGRGPWRVPLPRARRLAATAILLVALAGLFAAYRLGGRDVPVMRLGNPVQVTSTLGVEDHPTWSPDNRTVAYESSESGNWDIWLTQVGGAGAVNRTSDHAGPDRYPSWSPDGRQIAFWSGRDGGGYFVMPALGGTPTRVIATPGTWEFFHSAPAWSADGVHLAATTYTVTGTRFQQWLEIVSVVNRDTRRLELPGMAEARLDLAWSADGRLIAYVDGAQQQAEVTTLRVLRLDGGAVTVLTDGRSNVRRPRWAPDGRSLLYTCNCVGPVDLWQQDFSADGSVRGAPRRVTSGLEIRDAAFSPDGSRLVYSKGRWVSNVWRVPILEDRPATWADAEQMTFDQAYIEFVDVSPDGRYLAYSSDRSGNQDLYVMPIGGQPVQVTFDPAPDWSPGWSPDGRHLAFYSYRSNDREIWRMPAAGGPAMQLTDSPGLDAGSDWSPDGEWIAFRSERTGDSEIWIVSADGRTSRRLTEHPGSDGLAVWSPDGAWLAFVSNRGGISRIWRIAASGGEAEPLTRGGATSPRWSKDGAHVYFGGRHERAGDLWVLSLADRIERPLTSLTGRRGTLGVMPPATDGRFLYFGWRDDLGDIWAMDVLR